MAELTCSSCSKTYKSLNSLFRHKERCILINPDLDLLMNVCGVVAVSIFFYYNKKHE